LQTLCSLQFETKKEYQKNLDTLLDLISKAPEKSLLVAPEVCLTGFDYENFEKAQEFSSLATEAIKKISTNKTIILTMIEKRENKFYNLVKLFSNNEIAFERPKARLFTFGGEEKYFTEGMDDQIKLIEINGIKIGMLICFELRFKELWCKLEGADIIVVPSWWGAIRADHFKSLTKALAIINQCYVIASDSLNEECSKMSGIISPMGKELRNGNIPCLELAYDKKEIRKMRRYMDVGIG